MERVILHCDMNNYFATVEEKYNPSLRSVPFAVCGDPEMRHSIVMAKNSHAKNAGVITGLSFRQAKEICPGLVYIKADYPKYLYETKAAREIYKKYTDTVIPYGLDEAWIDLSETGVSMNEGRQIADLIRLEIMYSQGLSASVGVSDNLIFSKLGSDYLKPNATTLITKDNYRQLVWPLPASDLLFVGEKRSRVLAAGGIYTIGDIARSSPVKLKRLLGKAGHDIWCYANGDDRSFHPENDTIKSIGNTITPPEDITSREDACALIYMLSCAVCARLVKHKLMTNCISINMKDSGFNTVSRQITLSFPTDNVTHIFNRAFSLFQKHYTWASPLRSIGISLEKLVPSDSVQLSFNTDDTEDSEVNVNIDEKIKRLTERFGEINIEKSAATKDW